MGGCMERATRLEHVFCRHHSISVLVHLSPSFGIYNTDDSEALRLTYSCVIFLVDISALVVNTVERNLSFRNL